MTDRTSATTPAAQRSRGVAVVLRVLRAALVGLLPAVLTIVLLHGLVGGAISQYVPTISDDVSYWHQIATAREHGVHGGRYTYEEQKPLGPSHFGAWGPVYPLVMAAITSPFAWDLSTPPIFAIALFAIMLAIGTFMTNPRGWRLVALMAVVATSWPMYLALPTALQESFHMALGVLLATGLVVLAQRRDESRAVRLLTGGCLILVLLLASIRPVWAYMVFPALLLGRPRLTIRNMLAILGITAVVALLALALTVTMAAPYPYEDNPAIVIRAAHGLTGKVSAVLDNMGTNWKILTGKRVYLRSFTVTSLAGLTLVIGIVIALVTSRSRNEDEPDNTTRGASALWASDCAMVVGGGLVAPALTLYAGYSMAPSMRHLGPHLLLVSVFVVLRVPPRWLALIGVSIAIALLGATSFRLDFRDAMRPRYAVHQPNELVKASQLIRYDAHKNAWCNTILFATTPYFPPAMTNLPPGIGLSVTIDPTKLKLPLQSRWILINHRTRTLPAGDYLQHPKLRTPLGILYENPQAPC